MKQTQVPFTLQSNFATLKMTSETATLPVYIDLAIFDLMADGRKRSVNEVVSALAVLGYMRNDVNRRMVAMLHKSKMFVEAAGGKGKVLYEMKKGAVRPDTFAVAKPKHVVKESDIVLELQRLIPVTYRKHRIINLQETTVQNQTNQPQDNPLQLLSNMVHAFNTDNKEDPTNPHQATPEVPPMPQYVVERADPVRVGLWKVMADHEWYKSSDLVTLLADFYPSDIVRYHLRAMVKLDMVEVDQSNYQEFKYRLIQDVKMPEGL